MTDDALSPSAPTPAEPASSSDTTHPAIVGTGGRRLIVPSFGGSGSAAILPPGTGELSEVARDFLRSQVERLQPLEYVLVGIPHQPIRPVEVGRTENGSLAVRVPPVPTGEPLPVPQRSRLAELGFVSRDASNPMVPWERAVADSAEATTIAERAMRDVLGADLGETVDVFHGSHRLEHERKAKLEAVREQIEPVISDMLGRPPERDVDGDYLVPIGEIEVIVAPRASLDAVVVVRILAITNVGVEVTPDLGVFLARLNFGLMFGRFALDVEHEAIWFDETLLGGHTDDEELRFAIEVVANTARAWDEQLKQLFGGLTRREAKAQQRASVPRSVKPGQGGYL